MMLRTCKWMKCIMLLQGIGTKVKVKVCSGITLNISTGLEFIDDRDSIHTELENKWEHQQNLKLQFVGNDQNSQN